jgi:hypothetical protein
VTLRIRDSFEAERVRNRRTQRTQYGAAFSFISLALRLAADDKERVLVECVRQLDGRNLDLKSIDTYALVDLLAAHGDSRGRDAIARNYQRLFQDMNYSHQKETLDRVRQTWPSIVSP